MTHTYKPHRRGYCAEDIACEYLCARTHTLLARNYRATTGEIDIITQENNQLIVFTEVRYRKNTLFSHPIDTVTPAKQARIIHTAMQYIKHHQLEDQDFRFDIIAIIPVHPAPAHISHYAIEWVKDAFSIDDSQYFW